MEDKAKVIIKDLDMPEAEVEIGVVRRYNLGGFNNWLEISHKVSGSADQLKDFKNTAHLLVDITSKIGKTIFMSRKRIKAEASEEYEDDGKVKDSEEK